MSAQDSQAILAAARASLQDQRAGGRRSAPIGKTSAALRRAEQKGQALALLLALLCAAIVAPLALTLLFAALGLALKLLIGAGIGLGVLLALRRLLRPKPLPAPTPDTLRAADPKALVGQTQLWLEAQIPALPAPAIPLLNQIGAQLDALQPQLTQSQPQAQLRQLIGEHLPSLITNYTAIPAHLRGEAHAGTTPDQQLTQSLTTISAELASVTRQLAQGPLDALAIQTRYLDTKYEGS
jgi:hypothetical protein